MGDFKVDSVIYKGRPRNIEGREQKEIAVYDFLDKNNIEYERIEHTPVFSVSECNIRGEIMNIKISKNLFLCNAQKTRFYLLVMPGEKRYVTRIFSSQIGSSRLSFAPEEYMEKFIGTTPGSASIMGLINDTSKKVEVYFDSDVLEQEYFGCHPCVNTGTIKLKMSDVVEKYFPAVGHVIHKVVLPW